jgi:hypothetical protein
LPVPYVNLWGDEDVSTMRVEFDRNVGMDGLVFDDVGDTPNFLKQSPARQREVTVQGLCQVCRRPIPWSRRNLVVSDMSVDVVEVAGRKRPVVTEPWLDDRCAEIATRWCPGLIRRTRDERLTVVRVTSQRQVQLVVSNGWVEGALEEQTRARPVAMWVKLALLHVPIEVVRTAAATPLI